MNVVVHGRNLEVTPALKDYAEKRLSKFERILPTITEAVVNLTIEKHNDRAAVLLRAKGVMIQAESVTGEIYSSIDEVVEKLERQIKKYKGKLSSHRNKNKQSQGPVETEEPAFEPMIIKTKKFDMKPMSPEEAAMQMDLLDKDFFVFTNQNTGQINVIYRRKDGHFGLIEPA
ncbi:MAG: ribosome-associated translation inhibitor RaiA [Nitrospirae bacterium]|nr:MAG: ribosome-associated translation inhibitor RaiA [Nitrospirota bacterium]